MAKVPHLIASNALILWLRLVATAITTIFAVRFALMALGVDAFGVYAAVAALPLMFSFITGSMSMATTRMLAIGLTKAPLSGQRIFNASLGPHLAVAVLIVLVGETLGIWLLNSLLSVPDDMRGSALIVLRVSIAAAALGALLAPYEAMLQVRERFGLFAALDVMRSSTVLFGSWLLLKYSGDRLVAYAVLQTCAAAAVVIIGALISTWQYPEGRLRLLQIFDRVDLRQRWNLFSWTIVGSFAATARTQGFVVLANALFGPAGSAAMSVGNQLVGLIRQISTAISQVLAPRIYAAEARQDRRRMFNLTILACKYSSLIGAIVAAPLIIELPTVLQLWLVSPPPGASAVIAMMLIALLLDQLSTAMGIAYLAIGRVALYQIVCGLTAVAALPLAYSVAKFGSNLPDTLLVLAATSGLVAGLRLILFEPHFMGAFQYWLRTAVGSVLFSFGAGVAAGLAVAALLEPGIQRVILTSLASSVAFMGAAFISLPAQEKQTLKALTVKRPVDAAGR